MMENPKHAASSNKVNPGGPVNDGQNSGASEDIHKGFVEDKPLLNQDSENKETA